MIRLPCSARRCRHLDAVLAQLRSEGYEVRDAEAARLSPFRHTHINLLGRYTFLLPNELAGQLRPLCDPDLGDDQDDHSDADH